MYCSCHFYTTRHYMIRPRIFNTIDKTNRISVITNTINHIINSNKWCCLSLICVSICFELRCKLHNRYQFYTDSSFSIHCYGGSWWKFVIIIWWNNNLSYRTIRSCKNWEIIITNNNGVLWIIIISWSINKYVIYHPNNISSNSNWFIICCIQTVTITSTHQNNLSNNSISYDCSCICTSSVSSIVSYWYTCMLIISRSTIYNFDWEYSSIITNNNKKFCTRSRSRYFCNGWYTCWINVSWSCRCNILLWSRIIYFLIASIKSIITQSK